MHKPAKTFLYSIIAVISLLSGMLLLADFIDRGRNSKSSQAPTTTKTVVAPPVDPTMLEEEYRIKTKNLVSVLSSEITPEQQQKLEEAKAQLIGLRVPAKFKELHIGLVLNLDRLILAVRSGDEQQKSTSLAAINGLKGQYDWLN